jgi:DNA recombination protein Rad52
MTFTQEQTQMLQAPLDLAHVKKPTGSFGPKGDYLEGWHVINELNRIFGFGGWSYTIDLTQNALAEGQDSKGNAQWQVAYTCVCTLTVDTESSMVTRQDVGFGSGFAKQVGDAIEGATKEAATDALKRAARTFGNPFGLALYDKSRANVQAAPPPTITEEQRTTLMGKLSAAGIPTPGVLKRASSNCGREIKDLRDLPLTEYDAILQAAENRIAEKAQSQKEAA